jgi:hypothetical protein
MRIIDFVGQLHPQDTLSQTYAPPRTVQIASGSAFLIELLLTGPSLQLAPTCMNLIRLRPIIIASNELKFIRWRQSAGLLASSF